MSRGGKIYEIIEFTFSSLLTGGAAALIILLGALIIAGTARMSSKLFADLLGRITILGYSIPGAVIVVGVLILMLQLDNLIRAVNSTAGIQINIFLSNTLIMLFFAYSVRFMGIAFNSVESGYEKIGESYFEAARTLGKV